MLKYKIKPEFIHLSLLKSSNNKTLEQITIKSIDAYLDNIYDIVNRDRAVIILEDLFSYFEDLKHQHSGEVWRAIVEHCRKHPIQKVFKNCRLLDAYRSLAVPNRLKPDLADWFLGYKPIKGLEELSYNSQSARSLRERLSVFGKEIDRAGNKKHPHSRILSVCNGFLRELEFTDAYRYHKVFNLTAFDGEKEVLDTALHKHRNALPFKTKHCPLREWDDYSMGENLYGLAYSLSAFDFFSDRSAKRLLKMAFNSLLPGGKLLFANMSPDSSTEAFLEAFSTHQIFKRTSEGLFTLSDCLDADKVADIGVFQGSMGVSAYLEIEKK